MIHCCTLYVYVRIASSDNAITFEIPRGVLLLRIVVV